MQIFHLKEKMRLHEEKPILQPQKVLAHEFFLIVFY